MRILKGIAITGLALLLAAAAQPVFASCGDAALLGTNVGTAKSGIWTETGLWVTPSYYVGFLPFEYEPPVTVNFSGKWWALGTGDPAGGSGDDSNTWPVANWFYYYGPGGYGSFFAGEIFGGWGQSAEIDGCIDNNPSECTCILLTDRVGDQSYFALLAAQADPTNNTFFDQPGTDGAGNAGPIVLKPTPAPTVVDSVKSGIGVDLTVSVPALSAGIYEKDSCDCSSSVQYRVFAIEVQEGGPAPTTRDLASWTELSAGPTDVGATTVVNAACDSFAAVELYVAAQLVFDPVSGGGFAGDIVSSNSTRISCGASPTLADPEPPRIKPNRPVKPRRTKG